MQSPIVPSPTLRLLVVALVLASAACGGGSSPEPDAGDDGHVPMPDGGTEDAEVDAGPTCVPVAETCDTLDQDCDGEVDEDGLVAGDSVCDCESPTSIAIRYPAIVQSGVPAQLEVVLEGPSGRIFCNPGVVVTSTDAAARMPSEPLMRRYDGLLFATALVTGPTQSITVRVGELTATKTGISVVTDGQRVEPAITRVDVPDPSHFTTIPSTSTIVDDFVLDGGVTLGDTLYFFASNGLGPKLFSYNAAEGVRQRSNTNPTGPDHAWAGGFRAVAGAIYFNAYTAEGCIKIFRYAPGDAMVTTPIDDINPAACDTLPTQVGTLPSSDYGPGQLGSLRVRGDDTPFATRFDPVEVAGRVFFTAYDGAGYDVYEHVPGAGVVPITDFASLGQGASPFNLFVLGAEFGTLYFVGPNGTYEHIPGGPLVTEAATSDTPNVSAEMATGVRFGTATYFASGGRLVRYTLGETDAEPVSDTSDGASEDYPADLSVIEGRIFFSALDDTRRRHIYAHNPVGSATTTTPIPDPCGTACTDASQPIGMLGTTLYFNARGSDRALGFYRSQWGSGVATEAFTVNTAPMDDVHVVATVGDAVYFLAYEGYTGEVDGTKHPLFAADRGNGRFGFGRRQLYVLPAGSDTPVQVFDTLDDDAPDDSATGTKHPSGFTVVGDALYFTARVPGTHSDGSYVNRLYRHVPGQAGLVTTAVDDGIRIVPDARIAIGGRLYFVADAANDPEAPELKLFAHAAGDGTVSPSDAITDLVPGGSDEIALLTDVGGVLVFRGRDASGHDKLFRYRPGDGVLTSEDAVSDIVPGGDDALEWNPADVLGGDTSVRDGKLLLTSAGTNGFVYDPATDDVLTAADAVAIAGGGGELLYRHDGAYYLVPRSASVIDGVVYVSSSGGGGGPVQYARRGRPIAQAGGPVEYFRISPPVSGPVEYVRVCSAYGFNDRMIDGVHYIFVYIPGTDTCGYIATTPTHTDFPGYIIPFPSLGAQQTEIGTTGASHPLWHDAARGVTYVRGAIAHERMRPRVHKGFAYTPGVLTLLSPSVVGNDRASRPHAAGDATYFAVNVCGGLVDFDRGGSGYTCSRLIRYTP